MHESGQFEMEEFADGVWGTIDGAAWPSQLAHGHAQAVLFQDACATTRPLVIGAIDCCGISSRE